MTCPACGFDNPPGMKFCGRCGQEGTVAGTAIRAALDRAEALIRETGAKNYQAFIHLERARLARLEGNTETRVRELREAHRLFVAMGAPIRIA